MTTQRITGAFEEKFDAAIEAARAEATPALLALSEAAECADRASLDGEAWYVFAVGVAVHDARCTHLFVI